MCNCCLCGHEMIWQSDFSFEEFCTEGEGIVSIWECPNCGNMSENYLAINKEGDY